MSKINLRHCLPCPTMEWGWERW